MTKIRDNRKPKTLAEAEGDILGVFAWYVLVLPIITKKLRKGKYFEAHQMAKDSLRYFRIQIPDFSNHILPREISHVNSKLESAVVDTSRACEDAPINKYDHMAEDLGYAC